MRVTCVPPIDQWQPSDHASGPRVIATGHQAWLWHPGILAKDIAVVRAARHHHAAPLHLVVDHDQHEALQLALPVQKEDRLESVLLQLGTCNPHIPTGCQPPADPKQVIQILDGARQQIGGKGGTLLVNLEPLIRAWTDQSGHYGHRTLAAQLTSVLQRLMEPYTGTMQTLFSSELHDRPEFKHQVEQMTRDARRCVACYNRTVKAHADAGVALLIEQSQRVELPLWQLGWNRPRRAVFADLRGSTPKLVQADGQPLDSNATLAPKALLLMAVMRRDLCSLFVHGLGGARYDRITDQWWSDWQNQDLVPVTTVSCDLHLPFDVPVADRRQLAHALWRRHHLPHNMDRALELAGECVERKRHLLAHMDDDRDTRRRAQSFHRIHHINHTLAQEHAPLLQAAQRDVQAAHAGVLNRTIAHKRDWCFALYRPDQLQQIAEALQGSD